MPGILKIPNRSFVWRAKSEKPFAFLNLEGEASAKECLCFVKMFLPADHPADHAPGIGLGVVVSRKIGSAPIRNKIKRRLRSVFREISKKHQLCCTCLVIVRSRLLAEFDFQKLSLFFQKVVLRYFKHAALGELSS